MSARPWFPFYVADYQMDTLDLTLEQHGAYMLLLILSWRRPDGGLDESDLKRSFQALAAGLHGRTYNAVVPPLLNRFFTLGEDGLYRNKRLEEERQKCTKLSAKQSENALKRHAANRENNNLDHATVVPSHSHSQLQSQRRKKDGAEAPLLALVEPTQPPPSPSTPEAELYRRGREVLGKSSGGQITKFMKAKGGSIAEARAAIEIASTKGNPLEWFSAAIHRAQGLASDPENPWHKSI